MARNRIIRPEFFQDERIAEISTSARFILIGLWTLADQRGRLEDRPKRIKLNVVPYDNIDVNQVLNELMNHGFILRYDGSGRDGACSIIQIVGFEKQQGISSVKPTQESQFSAPTTNDLGAE